ncbi:DinB family protein [Deinococcus radiotolerans]|uniref:DNA damage-inducible protein DinB n=1 Tax=Deinococcus radiotolerans TaxID=1309407 RepID=A0ABQ2FIG3_9DEIO|nr:DinB family protein [Deinococcus radiotolerans]GGK98469.1 DNA damage-inducible protein DinB [Deinococcus radiotolerans]
MTVPNADLRATYAWARVGRERLLTWLESLPGGVYTLERPDFAFGSLRNVQVHVADCYRVWLAARGLGETVVRLDPGALPDVAALRAVYADVDALVDRALNAFTQPDEPRRVPFGDRELEVTGRWLFMHPLTHEFHHKGQLLTMGRVLGFPYPAGPDTDLGLPEEAAAWLSS